MVWYYIITDESTMLKKKMIPTSWGFTRKSTSKACRNEKRSFSLRDHPLWGFLFEKSRAFLEKKSRAFLEKNRKEKQSFSRKEKQSFSRKEKQSFSLQDHPLWGFLRKKSRAFLEKKMIPLKGDFSKRQKLKSFCLESFSLQKPFFAFFSFLERYSEAVPYKSMYLTR